MTLHFEFDDLELWDHLRFHLAYGKHNARTQRQLAALTGHPVRAIQEALEGAKRAGEPIVTGSEGVWLSQDRAELLAFYRANRRRIHTQWVNARGTLKAVAALDGVEQQRLPWKDAA